MITREEIRHLAGLCRLGLTENEEEDFRKGLASILSYVSRLSEADTAGAEPDFQLSGLSNVFRKDEVDEVATKEAREKIAANFPQRENGYLRVKAVFKEDENN
jgi:aspartyl-tRNA(Asn)/glutamyl-tRNA(Gln) amidotransferase subunit C